MSIDDTHRERARDDGAICVYQEPHTRHGSCPGVPRPTSSTAAGMCGEPDTGLGAHGFAVRCILDAGHGGWHRDEYGSQWSRELAAELDTAPAGLTADQQIRAHAVQAAATCRPGVSIAQLRVFADQVADWIRDGRTDEPLPPTEPPRVP